MDGDVGAVRIAVVRINLVEALRLEIQQHALPLPGDEILDRLEDHKIGLELLVF